MPLAHTTPCRKELSTLPVAGDHVLCHLLHPVLHPAEDTEWSILSIFSVGIMILQNTLMLIGTDYICMYIIHKKGRKDSFLIA